MGMKAPAASDKKKSRVLKYSQSTSFSGIWNNFDGILKAYRVKFTSYKYEADEFYKLSCMPIIKMKSSRKVYLKKT